MAAMKASANARISPRVKNHYHQLRRLGAIISSERRVDGVRSRENQPPTNENVKTEKAIRH